MNRLSQLHRLIYINWVLAKHGLDEIILASPWLSPIRFVSYANPWNWRRNREQSHGVRIRLALEELGPIFVKFGQMLSTRPDLIPEDIAAELTLLQDKVPPFFGARKLIEKIYKKPIESLFLTFDDEPLASASIAQVHAATLPESGKEVVVKVLRPGIEKTIRRDLSLLYTVAALAERYWKEGRRFRPQEAVAEFESVLMSELDLMREAANAAQLKRNFHDSSMLHIPEVYWSLTRTKILVSERIYGIPIADIATLKAKGFNLKKLAERGVEIFFTQVFRDCFFHADMHPGNIFVDPKNPEDPQYIAVDFGIVGSLNSSDQRYLAENMVAFFKRDYRRVAELHVASGWVAPNIRLDEFEATIRTVCEPIFERPLKDISCGYLLLRLFQAGKQFNMEVQPQLLLLQKTLIHVEGLGRQLYPELDLWSTAKPFLEKWLRQQMGVKAFLRKVRDNLPYWSEKLPELPDLIYRNMQLRVEQPTATTKPATQSVTAESTSNGFFLGIGATFLAEAALCWFAAEQIIALPLALSLSAALFGLSGLFFLLTSNRRG